jgi:chromosome segregation ATPase
MDQPGNHIVLRGDQGGAADRMRELLARTVQDHVADQRSNASALEDIRQRMEGLEWLVKEVREREVPSLAAQLDDLPRHFDQAVARPPGWAESLAEHIELLRTQVTPLAELHSLWADVSAVTKNVDERMARLQDSVGKLQQSMEAAAGRFSRLDKAVTELAQRTAHLDQEMSAVRDGAEVGLGALTAKLDQSAEAVQAVHGRIERLDERLAGTDDKLGSLDIKLTAADTKIGSTDARVAALDTKLERLDERLDDQYDRVSVIDKGLSSMDSRLGALQGKLGPVDGRLSAVDSRTARIGSLEDSVLTLAEALLRPPGHPAPAREGTRI